MFGTHKHSNRAFFSPTGCLFTVTTYLLNNSVCISTSVVVYDSRGLINVQSVCASIDIIAKNEQLQIVQCEMLSSCATLEIVECVGAHRAVLAWLKAQLDKAPVKTLLSLLLEDTFAWNLNTEVLKAINSLLHCCQFAEGFMPSVDSELIHFIRDALIGVILVFVWYFQLNVLRL